MKKTDLTLKKVGFIGGGNMASAIGAGLIHKGNVYMSVLYYRNYKIDN